MALLRVDPLDRFIGEKEFYRTFEETLHTFGWAASRFRAARNVRGHYETPVACDGEGWPDYFCVRPGEFFAAELKVGYNKPEPAQVLWAERMTAAGIEHPFWWPTDWQTIVQRLTRR